MLRVHYLFPENMWGVFDVNNLMVAIFATKEEAKEYRDRHNVQ